MDGMATNPSENPLCRHRPQGFAAPKLLPGLGPCYGTASAVVPAGYIHAAEAAAPTAGNPGRGELDDNQEINYPPIMRKLVEIGYKGFVGHEFIPTRDPLAGLKQAVSLCDV